MEYRLKEAALLLGKTEGHLRKACNAGKIEGARQIEEGNRKIWLIPIEDKTPKLRADYETLYREWVQAQASGYLTGKHISKRGVEANEYGMAKFWQYLAQSPTVQAVTSSNLRSALANVPVTPSNCHFSIRDQMYKGVRSFCKFLVLKDLTPENVLTETALCKPKRFAPARRTSLEADILQRLLDYNLTRRTGRTAYDIAVTDIIIHLLARAGLRVSELCAIRLADVDFSNGIIHIERGKGNKNREVGIDIVLSEALQKWLSVRPPLGLWLVNLENGSPNSSTLVARRIKRLASHLGVDITPHGLRRTCATLYTHRGMPVKLLAKHLGHASIVTTEGYIMSEQRHAIDWVRAQGRTGAAPPQVPAPQLEEWL